VAGSERRAGAPTDLDGTGLVVGVVAARWNADVVDRLAAGAHRAIDAAGARSVTATAPGAFELPFAARVLATSGEVDAIVVLGCVVRGETTHYEIVSEGCARGVMRVQLDTGVPIGFGVVTVEDDAQALARSEPAGGHNVGEEATLAAIEMALLARRP
jgi:6,7-dimethyl-8-ribityllumazine synthase